MRHLKLLMLFLLTTIGGGNLWAQTDVTTTYITNADFSSTEGWTQSHSQNKFWSLGNGLIGTYAVEGKKSTTDATHLATEYCIGMQCRWASNYAAFTQTTSELPTGIYTLSFDVEDVNTSTAEKAYANLFTVKVGDNTYTDTKTEWMNKSNSDWTTHTISFTVSEPATATISLGYGTGDNNIASANVPHLCVSHLKLTFVPLATADDYAALNAALDAAISAVEGKKLGFDAGEYAPYNGVNLLAAIAEAKTIDQEANNSQLTVQNLTAALNATWEANAEEVNAIWDPAFEYAYSTSGNVQPIAWTGTSGHNNATDVRWMWNVASNAGLAAVSSSKALFTKFGVFYGQQSGYELPLNADTYYTLAFKYGGWSDCKKDGYVTIADPENASLSLVATNRLPLDAVDGNSNPESWKQYSGIFKTNAAGNYVLGLRKDKENVQSQYVYGDFMLKATTVAEATDYYNLKRNEVSANFTEELNVEESDAFKAALDAAVPSTVAEIMEAANAFKGLSDNYLAAKASYDAWVAAKAAAQEALTADANANVKGEEQVALANAVDAAQPTTKAGYDEATTALTNATTAFAAAKTSYDAWVAAQTAAQAALADEAYASVTGEERTALEGAANTLTESKEGYDLVKGTIDNALAAFTAAKANYEALTNERAKALALGMTETAVNEYAAVPATSAADALAKTQNLKVAEYDFVTTNYAYPVALSDNWTSEGTNTSAATFSNEHWSGETREYKNQNDTNGQGWNANSWSLNFNQNVTLPAGSYVFKVAGRCASGNNINMALEVKKGEDLLGSVNDFPQSNSSRGINKEGATQFEGDGESFANNGNGFGWEWRYVKFDLDEVSTVNIGVSAQATAIHQWISFGDYTLQAQNENVAALLTALADYDAALAAAQTAQAADANANIGGAEKAALDAAITAAVDKSSLDAVNAATTTLTEATTAFTDAKDAYNALVDAKAKAAVEKITANVGEGAFKYNATENDNLFAAYTAAKTAVDECNVAENTEIDAEGVQALVDALAAATAAYNAQTLTAPAADKAFNLYLADGLNKTVTFKAGNANAGGYTIGYTEDAGSAFNQAVYFENIDGNQYKVFIVDAEGVKHYLCVGTEYNGNNSQIRTIENADDALVVEVIATAEDGVYNLKNTVANALIGSNGDAGVYTAETYKQFNINEAEQVYVPVTVAADKYATRIFPFAPAAIEGVTFYSCEGSKVGDVLTLTEVTEPQANVPYILLASEDVDVVLSGYGVAKENTYKAGWLTGVFVQTNVPAGNYVLQTGDDNKQAFFVVDGEEIAAPAYRAYLTVPATETGDARAFYFSFGEATGINAVDKFANGNAVIYDLQGRKVEHPTRGLYIINGKKVVIK